MSISSTSSTRPQLRRSECFIQSGSLDEWVCNVCTRLRKGHVNHMTLRAAQHHERHSAEHAQNVLEAERRMWTLSSDDPEDWAMPSKGVPSLTKEEVHLRESRLHVDLVQDMVPFWIRGVEAAEKGEELRLEEFLDTLQEASDCWSQGGGWGYKAASEWGNVWAQNTDGAGGWGSANGDRWSGDMASRRDKEFGPKKTVDLGWKTQRPGRGQERKTRRNRMYSKAYDFVEDIARQEAVDEARRRRMHNFFEMPTEEKVREIDKAIRELQSR